MGTGDGVAVVLFRELVLLLLLLLFLVIVPSDVRRSPNDSGFVNDRPPVPAPELPSILLSLPFGHKSAVLPKPWLVMELCGLGVEEPWSCSGRLLAVSKLITVIIG